MRRPLSLISAGPHPRSAANRLATLLGLILLGLATRPGSAQTTLARNLPSAPAPATLSSSSLSPVLAEPGVMLPAAPAIQRHVRWRSPMALSLYALAAGETFDMAETHRVLSHPQWLCGYNPGITGVMISAQNHNSMPASVAQVCAASPTGQAPDYAYEGSFQEDGWTSQLRVAGPRNFPAVLAWNIGLDASGAMVPFLFRHRLPPRRRLMSTLSNFAHAAGHIYGGFTNLDYLSGPAGSPNTYLSGTPQLNAQFPGPRWWGRQ